MEVEINMINVEDGDAIIVQLKKGDKKALILIDGGYKKYYSKVKKRLEELLPLYNNKISLVVCTHYDNDHIGGIEKILDDYHLIIEKIWIHKIENTLKEQQVILENRISQLSGSLLLESHKIQKSIKAYNNNLIIEGYKDLLRVVKKIQEYDLEKKVVEATRGETLDGFPEFRVISPTKEYYNQNLPELKLESILEDLKNNIRNKSTNLKTLVELFYESKEDYGEAVDYCENLEKSSLENSVTATNMVSIVTILETSDKKFLFTGDSGIETFEKHTPNWDKDLKNLFWLDIPHHGSKNNSSKRMLDVFNPITTFVSAKGATNRPSSFIEKCILSKERNITFEITNSNSKTWYLKFDQDGKFVRVLE